ncbi:uncharacterized protein LOC131846845 [Achroia grisella]|uniref:uncharacterized protein LOC131846845 n=1 Tax=Achroia grisella TaxID=688607 RepID=UPI0027D25B05|nr:uncharacterized protein LOC131846845 [Achroia grisella]
MKKILNILITCALLQNRTTQFYNLQPYQHRLMQKKYQLYNEFVHTKRRHYELYKRTNINILDESNVYGSGYRNICFCSCTGCNYHKKCCKYYCSNCNLMITPQPNIILYPYPVPVIIPHNSLHVTTIINTAITSTTAQTTTHKTPIATLISTDKSSILTTIQTENLKVTYTKPEETKWSLLSETTLQLPSTISTTRAGKDCLFRHSTCCVRVLNTEYNKLRDKEFYTLIHRPTISLSQNKEKQYNIKPKERRADMLPKYGIVPIPDNLAIDIMSQLEALKR